MRLFILASIFVNKDSFKDFNCGDYHKISDITLGEGILSYLRRGMPPLDPGDYVNGSPMYILKTLYKRGAAYLYTGRIKGGFDPTEKDDICRGIKNIIVYLADEKICAGEEIPGIVVLDVDLKTGSIEDFKQIEDFVIYNYIMNSGIIPGFSVSENFRLKYEFYYNSNMGMIFSEYMWSHGVDPVVYKVFFSEFDEPDMEHVLHKMSNHINGSEFSREGEDEGDEVRNLGNGVLYVNCGSVAWCIDTIILSFLKNSLVKYYINGIRDNIFTSSRQNVNNVINEMCIMYDMRPKNLQNKQGCSVSGKVEFILMLQDSLDALNNSVSKIEEINSNLRQERLSRYALWVAIMMIIPAVVALLNDGTVNSEKYSFGSIWWYLGIIFGLTAVMFLMTRVVNYKKVQGVIKWIMNDPSVKWSIRCLIKKRCISIWRAFTRK